MNGYAIALFFHIVGALGLFAGAGVEWTSLRSLRRSMTVEQIGEWLRTANDARRAGMIGMVMLLASGSYMTAMVWGGAAWIIATLVTLVLLGVITQIVTGPRLVALQRAVSEDHRAVTPTLRQILHQPPLLIAMQIRMAVLLGVVFLMTVKPDLGGTLITIAVAVVLGIVSALPMLARRRVQEEPAT